jgi:hypothetical protein
MKTHATALTIMKMQMVTVKKYYFKITRMANVLKKCKTIGDVEKLEL